MANEPTTPAHLRERCRQANSEIVILLAKLNALADSPDTELNRHQAKLLTSQLRIINQTFE